MLHGLSKYLFYLDICTDSKLGTPIAVLWVRAHIAFSPTQTKEHTMKYELIALRGLFILGSGGMFICIAAMLFGL